MSLRKYFVQRQAVLRYQYLFDPDLSYEDAVEDILKIIRHSKPPVVIEGQYGQPLLLFTALSDGIKFRLKVDERPLQSRDHVVSVCKPYATWIPAGLGQEERFEIKVFSSDDRPTGEPSKRRFRERPKITK